MTASTQVAASNSLRGVGFATLAGLLFSLYGLMFRLLEAASVWHIVLYRTAGIIPLVALALYFAHGRHAWSAMTRGWKVALLAAVPLAIAQILINFAFAHTTVASVLFVTALVPFTTALFAWIALGENIAARSVVAMLIALAGAAVVAGSGIAHGKTLGLVFAVCATLAIATFNLVLRSGRDAEMLPTVATSSVMASIVAGLILGFGSGDFSVSQYDFMLILAMGAGSLGAGLVFFTLAVRERPVAEMALLMQIEVVLTPIWVWLGVGEVPMSATLIGGGLILCALGLSISREFQHRRTDTAVRQ